MIKDIAEMGFDMYHINEDGSIGRLVFFEDPDVLNLITNNKVDIFVKIKYQHEIKNGAYFGYKNRKYLNVCFEVKEELDSSEHLLIIGVCGVIAKKIRNIIVRKKSE
jgi:hypothetical protein